MSVCLSVYPLETGQLPLGGISWNFIFEDFSKTCRENLRFIKSDKNNVCITQAPVYTDDNVSFSS